MRKLGTSELDVMRQGRYYNKFFRWSSDRDFFADECEFLYDPNGHLIGVDYRKDAARKPEN